MKLLRQTLFTACLGGCAVSYAQSQIQVGVTNKGCFSAAVVGLSSCADKTQQKPVDKQMPAQPPAAMTGNPSPSSAAATSSINRKEVFVGGVSEADVDDYLANYGKPPREAVRALLNPTDENIASVIKKEREQLAVVSYVAQRRVDIGQAMNAADTMTQLNQNDLPSLIGMRVIILTTANCNRCDALYRAANQLVTEFPSVDARIGVVGGYDTKEFLTKTAALGVMLPVASVSVDRIRQYGLNSLPAVIIADSRYQKETILTKEISNALDLEMNIVSYRKYNEKTALPKQTVHTGAQK